MSEFTQDSFDKQFITAAEICTELLVDRPTLHHAINRGQIPEGLWCGHMQIWNRESARPHIDDWKAKLNKRRAKFYPDQGQHV
ncbi:DNA-binding protein [Pseudomonas phage MiCath]|uniref:DNA-binding protein n=1 Tax=Pseudomonas phage MiCath TaxID=3003729 RepID=A0AAE9VFE1_9CAUD|nr:DNA-binding protein [Pseudomonas phage MiCath]WAX22396.1 DNA-binding protein [Pseudomonas phage MiCath]